MGELKEREYDYKDVVHVVHQIRRLLERLGLSEIEAGQVLELVQRANNYAFRYGSRAQKSSGENSEEES